MASKKLDLARVKAEIEEKLRKGSIEKHQAQILEQRAPAKHTLDSLKDKPARPAGEYVATGVIGMDELFTHGIPKGSSVLIAGGTGTGKTVFCLQEMVFHASQGKKCLYMSFEESEQRLISHMEKFGWKPKKLIQQGNLVIRKYSPFSITRSIDSMLDRSKFQKVDASNLKNDLEPLLMPKGFKPDFIVLDSLTAIASTFKLKEGSYRIYIEQLFDLFENLGTTSFLITETKQMPEIFSTTGVEEFLADGVIVLYNIKRADIRERAVEILKMRGESHQNKIVAMKISENGILVYPDQEIFGDIK